MGTNLEKVARKKKILTVCIARQQSLIDDFKERIAALLVAEGLGNEESYDSNELSNTSVKVEEASAINEALQFAEGEMRQLMSLFFSYDKLKASAEQGAVIITDAAKFFISVSIEKFKVDNEEYIGISVHSPLFVIMRGKTIGEKFKFNGKDCLIIDIF